MRYQEKKESLTLGRVNQTINQYEGLVHPEMCYSERFERYRSPEIVSTTQTNWLEAFSVVSYESQRYDCGTLNDRIIALGENIIPEDVQIEKLLQRSHQLESYDSLQNC